MTTSLGPEAAFERLSHLAEAPHALLSSLDTPDVNRAIGHLAQRLLPADGHAVWFLDTTIPVWQIVWSEGLSLSALSEITTWRGAKVSAVPFHEPLPVPDVTASPLLAERQAMYQAEGIRSMLMVPLRVGDVFRGTVVAYYRAPRSFSDADMTFATALGNLGSSALTTAELYGLAQQAQRRAQFLAGASTALGSSLEVSETLQTVARLAVPTIADWCGVDLVVDGQVERVAVAHVDPAKVRLATALRSRYPEDPASPYGMHEVLRTGRPIMMSRIPEELIIASAKDDEHLALMRALGLRSYMCLPLLARDRVLGVLTFVTAESGREYSTSDLSFAQDVAARAALAVENARAYDEAHRANRLKDEFLATLSHELRTPLNAILGYARLLGSDALHEARRPGAIQAIERNAHALHQIVEDVLDVSRIVTGKIRLSQAGFDLAGLITDAVASLLPTAEARGIQLNAALDQGLPTMIGDSDRLRQVVDNLLSNAVKFTEPGGEVRITLRGAEHGVEITMRDTGCGIAPEFLPHVFERFRQADGGFAREHGGLGLGLAIARELVELHGGAITAESPGPGLGATFRVHLPYPSSRSAPTPPPTPLTDAVTSSRLDGVHVLAVDDDPDALSLVGEILRGAGARVTQASSALDALDLVQAKRPDILVTDLGMPTMDGYELMAAVRRLPDPILKTIPAMAVTAYARSEDRVRVLRSGFQMYLTKPIDPAQLLASIQTLSAPKSHRT